MSQINKNVYRVSNYIDHSLIAISTITGCVSIVIPIVIERSAIGIKFCVITAGIKKYKSIIQKKKEKTWENTIVSKI